MTTDTKSPISRGELVAILAMLAATVALSIDGMLPVLPEIGEGLGTSDPNRVQLVIAMFMVGLGFGTFFTGPLSDAYGRHTVAIGGAVVFCTGAFLSAFAQSLETLLAARMLQGLGAAGPRVVAMAITRDLFVGRQMARIMSFVMIVFVMVPVIAPTLGAFVAQAFGWRAIFISFAIFSILTTSWLVLRQPETLAVERRRPFRLGTLASGTKEIFANRQVVLAIIGQTLIFSTLFAMLMTSQQIYDVIFDKADTFHYWFGLMSLAAAPASLINAAVVVRLGMRRVVLYTLLFEVLFTGLFLTAELIGIIPVELAFPLAIIWMISVFYLAGLGIANMAAIAMEPMGHMAGMAASVITATATVFSIVLAVPVGQAFDGTMVPLVAGTFLLVSMALFVVFQLAETPDSEATVN